MKCQSIFLIIISFTLSIATGFIDGSFAESSIIYVNQDHDLNSIINNSVGGETLIVASGDYPKIIIKNKNFTEEKPLVIKAQESGYAKIKNGTIRTGTALEIHSSSYVKVQGFVIEDALFGIYIKYSNHIILSENEIKNTGQEGIHIGYRSKYVDVIDNHIHDTGQKEGYSQYGEGVYVGSGKYDCVEIPENNCSEAQKNNDWTKIFPDNCEYIWIENNEIHDCGDGEGINVKGECFHITITGNEVYNISPGTDSQYNQAAVAIEAAAYSIEYGYLLEEIRDVWVMNNIIHDVSGGYSYYNNGIMFAGTGSYIIGNEIYNCDNKGIYSNDWAATDLPTFLYNNTVSSCGEANNYSTNLNIIEKYPGANPNKKQSWGTGIDLPSLLTQTQISQLYVSIFGRASEGSGNAYWCSNTDNMVTAANTMLNTEPAMEYFGETLNNNQAFIEFIYLNTLGKTYADDPDGVNYWVSELSSGKSKGQVIATLINAAIDPQWTGIPAQDQFLNKVIVCNYTADMITNCPDINDLSAFVNFIKNVTHDSTTLETAKALVDVF